MIHLAVPVLLAALLAGAGAYGMVARRNAVLVLLGAELLLNAVNLLLVTVAALPAGGLAAVAGGPATLQAGAADPLLPGQVLAIFVVTVAAAEIGVALAVVLLLFRVRGTVDLAAVTELGEASPDYSEQVGAGSWPDPPEPLEPGPGLDPESEPAPEPVGEPAPGPGR
jgi:NADH-quinone oxidoreductase subunit K